MDVKERLKLWLMLFVVAGVIPLTTLVAVAAPELPSPGFIAEHAEGFKWFGGTIIAVLCFFIAFKVAEDSRNNRQQWDSINNLDHRLSFLEGQHEVNHGRRESDKHPAPSFRR